MPITSTGKRREEISQWDTAAKQGLPLREAVPVSICRKTLRAFPAENDPILFVGLRHKTLRGFFDKLNFMHLRSGASTDSCNQFLQI